MTPHIIKESSESTTYCPIQDELFNTRRSIEVVGEITRKSVYSLILQLCYLHQADHEKEITMYINSPGGSVTDGLALYDIMAGISFFFSVCVLSFTYPQSSKKHIRALFLKSSKLSLKCCGSTVK